MANHGPPRREVDLAAQRPRGPSWRWGWGGLLLGTKSVWNRFCADWKFVARAAKEPDLTAGRQVLSNRSSGQPCCSSSPLVHYVNMHSILLSHAQQDPAAHILTLSQCITSEQYAVMQPVQGSCPVCRSRPQKPENTTQNRISFLSMYQSLPKTKVITKRCILGPCPMHVNCLKVCTSPALSGGSAL